MRSFTSRRFRDAFGTLPAHVQQQARRAYQLFQDDPSHSGLNFKKVDEENNTHSVRVGLGYRGLGQLDGSDIVWYWIGPHADYDKMI